MEKIEDYIEKVEKARREEELKRIVIPFKIRVLPGYIFRRSKPAIVGIEVLEGRVRPGVYLLTEKGKRVGKIMEIQSYGKRIPEAKEGDRVAISIQGPIIGRHIKEGDILYSDIPLYMIPSLERKTDILTEKEIKLLKEIRKMLIFQSNEGKING